GAAPAGAGPSSAQSSSAKAPTAGERTSERIIGSGGLPGREELFDLEQPVAQAHGLPQDARPQIARAILDLGRGLAREEHARHVGEADPEELQEVEPRAA